jgi:methionyl-tRNA formyltransferase
MPDAAVNSTGSETDEAGHKLRLLFVTEDDPLYVIRFFEVFLDEYPRDEFEVVAITVDEAFHEPIWTTARRMLRFYGPVGFVRLGLRFALVKARGRSIANLAREAGIRELSCSSVNDPDYVKQVRDLEPDVIISVAAPEIFKDEILNASRLRCINIHSGCLPKYRGMMPTFWQLLHGEKHATVTVHEMAAKLDAGDVLGTVEFPLRERDVLDRVITETKRDGARLMIDVLRRIADGTVQPQPLDMREKGYFSFPKPDDVKVFRRKGHRLL